MVQVMSWSSSDPRPVVSVIYLLPQTFANTGSRKCTMYLVPAELHDVIDVGRGHPGSVETVSL